MKHQEKRTCRTQDIQHNRDCIHRKTWCMGPYAGVDYNSLYLIVNSVVTGQLCTPTTKGKVWSGKDLFYWLSTFVSRLLISKEKYGEGEGKGCTLCL
jgi:hypothetical protein